MCRDSYRQFKIFLSILHLSIYSQAHGPVSAAQLQPSVAPASVPWQPALQLWSPLPNYDQCLALPFLFYPILAGLVSGLSSASSNLKELVKTIKTWWRKPCLRPLLSFSGCGSSSLVSSSLRSSAWNHSAASEQFTSLCSCRSRCWIAWMQEAKIAALETQGTEQFIPSHNVRLHSN